MRAVIGLSVLLNAAWVHAQEQDESATAVVAASNSVDITGQLVQLLLGLLLVIGVIFLLAWLVRRVQHSLPMSKSEQTIRLVATQALGPRERLLLVQVGKEQVLLGLTPGTIEPLHVMQEPVEVADVDTTTEFGKKLKGLLNTQGQKNTKETP